MIHTGRYVNILTSVGTSVGDGGFTFDNGGGSVPTNWEFALITWAITNAFALVEVTRDSNSAIIRAKIQWPDGTLGDLTTDQASAYPGCVDAWNATYLGVDQYRVTQAAVTRDNNGAVINQPPISITKGL